MPRAMWPDRKVATTPGDVPAEARLALVWVSLFETGNAKVDREHRELLIDINNLSNCLVEGRKWPQIVRMSKKLRETCFAHFRDERVVLERSKYVKLATHERQHRYIEQQLDNVLAYIDGVARPSRAEIEAVLYLHSMLIRHFLRYDIAFKSRVLHARNKDSPSRLRKTR
jgi:hemerythrin-like metal-binding protein